MTATSSRGVSSRWRVQSPPLLFALVVAFALGACAASDTELTTAPAASEEPSSTAIAAATAASTLEPTTEPAPEAPHSPEPTLEPSAPPTPEPTATPESTLTPEATPAAAPSPAPRLEAEPSPGPSSAPTASPAPPGQIDGFEIDQATGLPIVPEAVGGPWWWVGVPTQTLDTSLRWSSDAPTSSAIDPEQGRISLLAEFESHEAALEIASELEAALGDPDAEAAWLTAAGQAEESSFEWLGTSAALTPFVQVIDRWLIVSELAYQAEYDPGVDIDAAPRYQSPLAIALSDLAVEVVVEDASSVDKYVAFDLTCRGDRDVLVTLSQDIADNNELYDMQPLWLEPGITEDQRRARRTLRLLNVVDAQALVRLAGDPEFELAAAALREVGPGGATATEEALEDLRVYVEEAVLGGRPDLEPLMAMLDPEVVAVSARQFANDAAVEVLAGNQIRPSSVASGQFAASRYGAHKAPIPWIMGEASTYAGLQDDELSMSLSLFNGVAAGLGPLVDYLEANGCADIRVAFTDYGYGVSLRS